MERKKTFHLGKPIVTVCNTLPFNSKNLLRTIMHHKSILTLEYPKILERVAKEAAFSASKELVMELEPTPDITAARRRLAYTTASPQLPELSTNPTLQSAHYSP